MNKRARWTFALGVAAAIFAREPNRTANAQTPQIYPQASQVTTQRALNPQEQAAKNLIQTLGEKVALFASQPRAKREAGFTELMGTYFDVPHMSRYTLGRQWNELGSLQPEFVRLFSLYAPLAVSDKLEEYLPPSSQFTVVNVRNVSGITTVSSTFTAPTGKTLQVDWYIDPTESGKIFNFAIAGGINFASAAHQQLVELMARNPDRQRAPVAAVRQQLELRGIQAEYRPENSTSDSKSQLVLSLA